MVSDPVRRTGPKLRPDLAASQDVAAEFDRELRVSRIASSKSLQDRPATGAGKQLTGAVGRFQNGLSTALEFSSSARELTRQRIRDATRQTIGENGQPGVAPIDGPGHVTSLVSGKRRGDLLADIFGLSQDDERTSEFAHADAALATGNEEGSEALSDPGLIPSYAAILDNRRFDLDPGSKRDANLFSQNNDYRRSVRQRGDNTTTTSRIGEESGGDIPRLPGFRVPSDGPGVVTTQSLGEEGGGLGFLPNEPGLIPVFETTAAAEVDGDQA